MKVIQPHGRAPPWCYNRDVFLSRSLQMRFYIRLR